MSIAFVRPSTAVSHQSTTTDSHGFAPQSKRSCILDIQDQHEALSNLHASENRSNIPHTGSSGFDFHHGALRIPFRFLCAVHFLRTAFPMTPSPSGLSATCLSLLALEARLKKYQTQCWFQLELKLQMFRHGALSAQYNI